MMFGTPPLGRSVDMVDMCTQLMEAGGAQSAVDGTVHGPCSQQAHAVTVRAVGVCRGAGWQFVFA